MHLSPHVSFSLSLLSSKVRHLYMHVAVDDCDNHDDDDNDDAVVIVACSPHSLFFTGNETPVPKYSLALMIIGGIGALSLLYFSIRDARLSLDNVRALRSERAYLLQQRAALVSGANGNDHILTSTDPNLLRTLDCFLDMNTRELGTELVDRVGMDVLLGLSLLLVGVGTLMATTGDHNSREFLASNLLTGYIGNTPCAVYGVANLVWSSYVWLRARKQQRAALNYVRTSTRISQMLRNRTSSLQLHAALNGLGGIVAGGAALVTSTMWWGYVILVPCVITSGVVNVFWRRCVGYERHLIAREISSIDQDAVLEALRYASACRERIARGKLAEQRDAFSVLVEDGGSLAGAIDVLRKNALMEAFCLCLLQDANTLERLRSAYPPNPNGIPEVDWDQLLATDDEAWVTVLLKAAKDTINQSALRSFIYQERHLLEVLGCYMCRGAEFGRRGKGKKATIHAPPARNVHTYAGRHANDWLFGGFSLTSAVKGMFSR